MILFLNRINVGSRYGFLITVGSFEKNIRILTTGICHLPCSQFLRNKNKYNTACRRRMSNALLITEMFKVVFTAEVTW